MCSVETEAEGGEVDDSVPTAEEATEATEGNSSSTEDAVDTSQPGVYTEHVFTDPLGVQIPEDLSPVYQSRYTSRLLTREGRSGAWVDRAASAPGTHGASEPLTGEGQGGAASLALLLLRSSMSFLLLLIVKNNNDPDHLPGHFLLLYNVLNNDAVASHSGACL